MTLLETIEIPAESSESAVIIALHGRGSSPQDIAGLAGALTIPSARWVIPTAPIPLGAGYTWYQQPYTDLSPPNRTQFNHARDLLRELAKSIRLQSGERPIGFLGFSQGGVLSLDYALRNPEPIDVAVVLSGGLYDPNALETEAPDSARSTPIFWAHGTHDSILPIGPARQQSDLLTTLGTNLTFNEYPIDHTVSSEVIKDARAFLLRTIQPG